MKWLEVGREDYPRRGGEATTTYGLHSFKYYVVKLWNSLPDNIRRECSLTSFNHLLETVSFQ